MELDWLVMGVVIVLVAAAVVLVVIIEVVEMKAELVREVDKLCYITRIENNPVSSLRCKDVVQDFGGACLGWIN